MLTRMYDISTGFYQSSSGIKENWFKLIIFIFTLNHMVSLFSF